LSESLVNAIEKIAKIGWDNRQSLREFECNPLIVTATGITAVDALGIKN
jgi:succinyl-CoA synthetase beta subunit